MQRVEPSRRSLACAVGAWASNLVLVAAAQAQEASPALAGRWRLSTSIPADARPEGDERNASDQARDRIVGSIEGSTGHPAAEHARRRRVVRDVLAHRPSRVVLAQEGLDRPKPPTTVVNLEGRRRLPLRARADCASTPGGTILRIVLLHVIIVTDLNRGGGS